MLDTLHSLDTVVTLGGDAFFKTGFTPRSVRLPPYRPPCLKVAHLFKLVDANEASRNAFGPILIYLGSKRLKPLRGISRESVSQRSIELFELFVFNFGNVPHFLNDLVDALPADVQAVDSQ